MVASGRVPRTTKVQLASGGVAARPFVVHEPGSFVWSPATLADKIADVVERGDFDWLSFYFPDYLNDVKTFGEEVLPRLVDRGIGLRGTEKPSLLAPAAA